MRLVNEAYQYYSVLNRSGLYWTPLLPNSGCIGIQLSRQLSRQSTRLGLRRTSPRIIKLFVTRLVGGDISIVVCHIITPLSTPQHQTPQIILAHNTLQSASSDTGPCFLPSFLNRPFYLHPVRNELQLGKDRLLSNMQHTRQPV